MELLARQGDGQMHTMYGGDRGQGVHAHRDKEMDRCTQCMEGTEDKECVHTETKEERKIDGRW